MTHPSKLPFLANMSRAQLDTFLLTADTGQETHVVKRGNRIIKVQRVETVVYAVTVDGQNWRVQADPSAVVELHVGMRERIKRWWYGNTRHQQHAQRATTAVQRYR